jgi:RNA methyltransferase, TrmH family
VRNEFGQLKPRLAESAVDQTSLIRRCIPPVMPSLPALTRAQGTRLRALLEDKRIRTKEKAFVVEGAKAVGDLLARFPEKILTLVVTPTFLSREEDALRRLRLKVTAKQYSCSELLFGKLSDLDAPQGILAVVQQPTWDEEKILSQSTILGIFGERLQDPTNVGAIIRTAAALNVDALWLASESADVYNPKVVRAASGALLSLPIFEATDVAGLIRGGCRVYAAEVLDRGTTPIDEIVEIPQKLVLAVGNEGCGLSVATSKAATVRFTIPLSRDVESLNVAATVAISSFHFSRLPRAG